MCASAMDTKESMTWKGKSQCTLAYFTYLEMQGQRQVINWLMNVGLISAKYECPKCDNFMKITARKDVIDGYDWRCRKQGGTSIHDVCRSLRKGSFISNCKLSMCDVLRIIRLWFGRCMVEFVMKEVNVSSHSVIDLFRFCREVCMIDIMNESSPIGGEGFTVEVVEFKFSQPSGLVKGREHFNGKWIIGGIERGTNRCFLQEISDRTTEELLTVISEYILPGTVVISDCWNVYDCLSDESFIELGVDKNLTFKSPGSSKNEKNNAIEPVWSAVKRFLRSNTKHVEGEYDSYLGEYLWRKKYFNSMDDDVFKAFLLAIANLYNPPGRDLPSS